MSASASAPESDPGSTAISAPSTPPSSLTERLRDRYKVERLLGRGGMGAVYLARDLRLDRLVAVKELPAELAGDVLLRERFLREVRMAAGFSHPNVVPVYAVEEQQGALAFVMGFVEGESLAERVRRAGPIGVREAVRLLQDVAYALAYAHGRGVVHRDLKPDNIMIERATGRALLMDFGVARPIDASPTGRDGMTRVGEVVGTPEYMSPEQATGDTVDGRSDLYALGLTAFYALTGEVAFGGDSIQRILVRQLTEAPPSLAEKRPDLPDALCAIVDRCLAKDREDRFASAEALIEALEAAQVAAPDVATPIRLFAAELETLGLIGMFMLLAAVMIATSRLSDESSLLDALVPVVLLVAVFLGRLLQTRAEVQRLHADGFEPHVIRAGLGVVLAEREARRAQLRTNPAIVSRRWRTIAMGAFQLLMAPLLVWGALRLRVPNATGGYSNGLPGVTMLFSGLVCGGIGLVLILRSPFRGGLPERLMKRLAFGWPSRWLIGRDSASTMPGTTLPPQSSGSGVRAPAPNRKTTVAARPTLAPPATNAGSATALAALPAGDEHTTQTLAAIDARLARIEAAIEASAQRNSQPLR